MQVMFDTVNIGHFVSPSHDGCPDGSLQVAEINRPLTGGKWCGTGQGYSVYYSETSAIALTLGVAYSPDEVNSRYGSSNGTSMRRRGDNVEVGKGPAAADEFEFRIRYKFIPRSLASVRLDTFQSAGDKLPYYPVYFGN